MAVVKVVPFPGSPGQQGPAGPAGPTGPAGVVAATAPITYSSGTVGIDQDGFDHIGNVDYVQYNTNPSIIIGGGSPGNIAWDAYHETLRVGVGHGATLDLGQEFQMPVYNISGEDIPKGTVVMAETDNNGRIITVQGGKFRVAKAVTNGTFDSHLILGVALTNIFNGEGGIITTRGHVHNTDVDGWEIGDILWADPTIPGGLTTVKPGAPNLKIAVAVVTYHPDEPNGTLFILMDKGSKLGETDSNVEITDPQDGDVLKYNATTGIWYNAQP